MPGAEPPKAGDEHLRHGESGSALEVLELRSVEICEFRVARTKSLVIESAIFQNGNL